MMQRWAAGLVYSNLFVAIVLGTLTASSFYILPTLDLAWYVPLSVFFGSHMLYSFHRLYKIDFIPRERLEARHRWMLGRGKAVRYAMVFSMFFGMLLLPNFQADAIIWLIPAGLVSVGYTIPILPSEDGWRRFRDIPYTKPLIISFVVSYFTLAFPVFEQQGIEAIFEGGFLRAFSERFLFLLAVTIPFDMRDMRNDHEAGLETLATEYGFKAAKRTGYIVITAWLVLVFWRLHESDYAWPFIVVPLALLAGLLLAYFVVSEKHSDLFYVYVFEGLILCYAILWSLLGILH